MDKKTKNWLIYGGIAAVVIIWLISGYNGLVNKDEKVSGAVSEVENAYKRRADLIPNLVESVKKYTQYEEDLFKDVTEARAAVQKASLDLNNATPEQMKAYFEAQDKVGASMRQIIAVAENYPDPKAVEVFTGLMHQLEGTEDRIKEARRQWIIATKEYNQSVRRFPNNILASLFGFEKRDYFETSAADKDPVKVDFGE